MNLEEDESKILMEPEILVEPISKPITKAVTESGVVLKKFRPEDVETVLSVLALNGGNYSRTQRQVESEYDIQIHTISIRKMALEYFPVKYAEIQDTLGGKINTIVTGRIGELALKGTEIQGTLLDRINDQLKVEDNIPVKDLAPSFRNVSQATKDNIIQKQLLENKPTSITDIRTIEEAIKELEDDDIVIDATVVEEDLPMSPNMKNQSNSDKNNTNTIDQDENIITHQNETIEDFPF